MKELNELDQLKIEALKDCNKLKSAQELQAWRVRYLGKKSRLVAILRGLSAIPVADRSKVGAAANQLKNELQQSFDYKETTYNEAGISASVKKQSTIDVTLPGRKPLWGNLHILNKVTYEISDIFASMGFKIAEGPEVETSYYNFDALNIPAEHPARDTMDTFWLDNDSAVPGSSLLMRTHTSPMQVRYMEKYKPPIRIIVPGKVYRYEATDASHIPMFQQIEGLAVDEKITMADLKGILYEFVHRFFGTERKIRFRCDYFPFVEPGAELAIDCSVCKGEGCRVCGGSGWLEVLGAGMVHPKVLQRVDVNPKKYSGFAFGIGIERLAMLRYNIDDIRLFYNNDLRFLKQF
jgi:phenylalanyl-tRNA synthetase alpha chain